MWRIPDQTNRLAVNGRAKIGPRGKLERSKSPDINPI